eukprot:CAMPEP_0172387346 /NCGR_PEP_ID=MMETSP1061-20121228/4658_1 /TAXON_ID=37318 /ORGANISM="Pseudo-nitzschia pungens, Strain cf. pungens" /LENGTH=42 /DNA_ID= /DNA_START= /DNA_END= /DNA_ORIENTATION=
MGLQVFGTTPSQSPSETSPRSSMAIPSVACESAFAFAFAFAF